MKTRIVLGKHEKTQLDRARDELFSHIQRCGALNATQQDKAEWLDETIDFIAERYPGLSAFELTDVEMMGKRYLRPAIPHGGDATAQNRAEWEREPAEV